MIESKRKKLLLLGGSSQQIVAIETAKRLGFDTVLCDYLPDNPGQYIADKFYLVSTTDKDKILQVAQQEQVDGIIAYASDPAAPTAAYVAEKQGLYGIPYTSAEILCNKDKFRSFLSTHGFSTPKARGYDEPPKEKDVLSYFQFPIIVKPVDSSGSKGTTVLHTVEGLQDAIAFAMQFSRSGKIIIEEFIQKKHEYLIGGDIIVVEGEVVLWGLLNCHRDSRVNSLVPVGKSFPLKIDEKDLVAVKETLCRLVRELNIRNAAMNVELIVDSNGNVWPIDIGPRNGGNMIPDLLSYIFEVDVVEMVVKMAVGEKIFYNIGEGTPFYATHNLHTDQNGKIQKIEYSDSLKKCIVKEKLYYQKGDVVEYFDNAAKALGILFLKFENEHQMMDILSNMDFHIRIVLS